jgi:16S rRNA (uracil1498-N3)-methyltransferase
MHRFFVSPDQIIRGRVRFRPDQAHQIGRVLRLGTGDDVVALDGAGRAYTVTLDEVTRQGAAGRITAEADAGGEPRAHLTLYQSLLKRDKFEWVLQKGTEIGVSRFVPVLTRRTLVRDAETVTPEKRARWERIITEAAEQSGRGRRPELAAPLEMVAAIDEVAGRGLIAWEAPGGAGLGAALAGWDGEPLALFIGPEGGYETAEIEAAAARGIMPVTLGPRILRTETAALVAAALVLHTLGELER